MCLLVGGKAESGPPPESPPELLRQANCARLTVLASPFRLPLARLLGHLSAAFAQPRGTARSHAHRHKPVPELSTFSAETSGFPTFSGPGVLSSLRRDNENKGGDPCPHCSQAGTVTPWQMGAPPVRAQPSPGLRRDWLTWESCRFG